MNTLLARISIRTRLLLLVLGSIGLGFGLVLLTAGQQLAQATVSDYQQQLLRTVQVVAAGMYPTFESYEHGDSDPQAVLTRLDTFSNQIGAHLQLYIFEETEGPFHLPSWDGMPEIESAIQGTVVLAERPVAGVSTYYTAARILKEQRSVAIVQLSVPTTQIENVVWQRWLSLSAIGGAVALIAVIGAVGVRRSIVNPLGILQNSAVQWAQGDFSHRTITTSPEEIHMVATAFNHMAAQVETIVAQQRAFASNTSHELRTPLTAIRLRTEALREDATLDASTIRRYITEIDEEIIRLTSLVESLTELSQFEAKRAVLGKTEVDMHRFANQLILTLQPITQACHIVLDIEEHPTPLQIRIGLGHLHIIFRNLLENAIKYSESAGTIHWQIYKNAQGIESRITDTGQGITTEALPHIFERFYRADTAHTRQIPGTGLGLALVKVIVDAYGGKITASSEGVGRGMSVTVWLPSYSTYAQGNR